jgi:hypothetical protein
MKYNTFEVFFRTLRCRLFGKTDFARWIDTSNYDAEWEERIQLISRVVPKHTRVIEFGAGKRQLESYLDPTCTWTSIPSFSGSPVKSQCALPHMDVRIRGQER